MDTVTYRLGLYIRDKGTALTTISEATGIPYQKLWFSLNPKGKRSLRSDECLAICEFLEKNPMDFYRDSA